MYKIRNLSSGYGKNLVIENLSLTIEDNKIIGILGPNGSGKTTLLETIECIKEKKSGSLVYNDKEVDENFKNNIGIQFQAASFYRKLKVKEIFDYFAAFFKSNANVKDLMAKFDLLVCKNKYYEHLSGGMKQKVAVAIALLNDTAGLVFLDEPTAGMDVFSRKRLWKIIKDLRGEGKTIVMATHYIEEAEALCDIVVILSKGQLLDKGTKQYLIDKYCRNHHLEIEISGSVNYKDLMNRFGFIKNIRKTSNGFLDITIDSTVKHQSYFSDLMSYFTASNVVVNYLNLKQPSLEEAFINMCGYKLDENGDLTE
ncbi:MAG: ABC transporter ATP-binding protein [Spirochaetales bacterium]|nr:ABC transporter ATP-binding protein [Spirochaetales bacterium]